MEKEERTKINIELPIELLEKLRIKAKNEERSVSAVIRLLVKDYVEKN